MIASRLKSALQQNARRPFLATSEGTWTYGQTQLAVTALAQRLKDSRVGNIACYLPDSVDLVLLMLAASVNGTPLAVFNRDYSHDQVAALLTELEIELLFTDAVLSVQIPCAQRELHKTHRAEEPDLTNAKDFPGIDSQLLIFTSGTTQKPRCVKYLWSDLLAQVGTHKAVDGERWLLAYKLNHFAGVQMLAHILCSQSTLVLAKSTRVADAVAAMTSLAVTHVSSTPTFWRFALALLAGAAQLPRLRQITLGSEPVSSDLLAQLASLFPDARIVHIYALTEAGSCISVSDGKPGLPLDILQRPADAAVQFRIVEGELHVRTQHGMRGYRNSTDIEPRTKDGWLATGDLVKIDNERILFMGRESEVINVGGVKVHPLEVENVVSAVPGVKLARVYGRDNPVVGQIVAVDLTINEGCDPQVVEDSVREACRILPRHSMPRSVTIVDTIDTNNFKLSRRGSEAQ